MSAKKCLCGCGRIPPDGHEFFEDACLYRGLEIASAMLNGQRAQKWHTGQRVETPRGLGVIWSYEAVNDQWLVQLDANAWDLTPGVGLLPFAESEIVPIEGDGA